MRVMMRVQDLRGRVLLGKLLEAGNHLFEAISLGAEFLELGFESRGSLFY